VTVGVVEVGVVDTRYGVSQPGADAERYRCACSRCTLGLAGRGDGYQCGLDWGVLVSIKCLYLYAAVIAGCRTVVVVVVEMNII